MLTFSTKAETLLKLGEVITSAKVLPQVLFTVSDFRRSPRIPLELLRGAGLDRYALIVRSSSKNEDTVLSSNAGRFLSIGGVTGEDAILKAVDDVAEALAEEDAQIFIQPYLADVELCGVAFTADPNTGGNYYVINYDDVTGSTSSVTSGDGERLKTYYEFKGKSVSPPQLEGVIRALAELEEIFANRALDVEFAIASGELYILQVRPLVLTQELEDIGVQRELIGRIREKLRADAVPHPFLRGRRTVYGVMPDWNPAEIIGIRPRPLALSMYRNLVTDSVWAYQRNNYGYKNMRSFPLMVDFAGLPYIDTRISFNSFLPRDLSDTISEKLINYYTDRLVEDKTKHDKIEFDIVFSCYSFDTAVRIKTLENYGFSAAEIESISGELRQLTNIIINNKNGLWHVDRDKIDMLAGHHSQIMKSSMPLISKIYWLMEYCKRYGTLPFAGLARAGFIAVQFLNSLVSVGAISDEEKSAYMGELKTISSDISADFATLRRGAFLEKYGHLRPGTYDICSLRYDEAADSYFDFSTCESTKTKVPPKFKLSIGQFSMIERLLEKQGISCNVLELFDFIKSAIEGREYSKFVFTKTLSDVLELLVLLGKENGISREEMSYIDVHVIERLYSATDNVKEELLLSVEKGKEKYAMTRGLTLPPVIVEENDLTSFFMPDNIASFVTQNSCEAEIATIEGRVEK